jgi:two-component system CheB/CheR fusion protein
MRDETAFGSLLELAAATQLGLWQYNLPDGGVSCSEEVLRITGLTQRDVDEDPHCLRRIVHPDDVEAVWAADEAARAGRPFQAEYRVRRPDGALRWVAVRALTECGPDGVPLRTVGTLADITERKRAEEALRQAHDELEMRVAERTRALALANEQLANEVAERRATEDQVRELLGQLVNAEEEERRRLARELHDTLGQHLTALSIGLKGIQEEPALPPGLRARLARLRDVARRIDDDIDQLVYQLRPAVLDDLGLDDALRELARAWAEESRITVDLHTRSLRGRRFPSALETTVYRVVQEALTNVCKHAQATRVSLIVEQRGDELRAIVEDDGCGFEPPVSLGGLRGRQLGLRGMAERASQAGGRLEVEAAPGSGTTVYLTIPIVGESA